MSSSVIGDPIRIWHQRTIELMALMAVDNVVLVAWERPGTFVDAFLEAAREAIQHGAQVLVRQISLAAVLWQVDVFRVDEAPLIDALAAVETAELLVEPKRSSGLACSHLGYYWEKLPADLAEHALARYRKHL